MAPAQRGAPRGRLDGERVLGHPHAGFARAGVRDARPTRAPPAELADAVAVPEADTGETPSTSPAEVVRELGDPSPPADAVPTADPSPSFPEPTAPGEDSGPQPPADNATSPTTAATRAAGDDGPAGDRGAGSPDSDGKGDHITGLPPEIGPWMAAMERRTDTAEALAAAETLPEATKAVHEAGGLDGVRTLADAGDEAQLRHLARRARRLADRRAGATIPVETLAALA
ncbi:hypothetical protein [Haloarcula rara]|uniref:hypothetical protein n=1 Tax=Haloarcula rara TaxID=3033387 RepID=UPI0023E8138B|nr:hypothetical protein [Halomicroarcula sp. SHR3]